MTKEKGRLERVLSFHVESPYQVLLASTLVVHPRSCHETDVRPSTRHLSGSVVGREEGL